MSLTAKQNAEIKDELDTCNKPLFFFHDDADGLASFLLMYRYKREGKGVCVKSHPKLDNRFFKIVKEYCPDKIFVLDLAMISEEFAQEFNIPIIWIDHHPVVKLNNIKYYNPRLKDPADNTCASQLCYGVVDQDLWIAVLGIIGDWQVSKVTQEFSKKFPDLLPPSITTPEKALFDSPLSELIQMINFILKGTTQDVMKCVKIMTRIESPYELINKDTSRAKFLNKRYQKIRKLYYELLKAALKTVTDDKILLISYKEDKMSFTGELSNELLYRYPDKLILVCREKGDEMKCSLRSGAKTSIPDKLEKALVGVEGYGGGHEHACGACIKTEFFNKFVEQLRDQLN